MTQSLPQVTIYTDGGADPNPGIGGWAVVLLHPETGKVKEISGGEAETTNNRMELTAAIEALASLKEPCQVEIFTDSQYLRRGITEWLPVWQRQGWKRKGGGAVLNDDLWRRLASLVGTHRLSWQWVKGHAGNRYNERADELATQEIRQRQGQQALPSADTEVFLKVSGGPRAAWAALIRRGGAEEIRGGSSSGATANLLDVLAAAEVVESLPREGTVAIYTGSDYLRNGAEQWIEGWRRRNWQTVSGGAVKNAAAWRRLDEALRRRPVRWVGIKGRVLPELKSLEQHLKQGSASKAGRP